MSSIFDPIEYKTTPLEAIKHFCYECQGGESYAIVKDCTGWNCDLYPYRFGKNPYRKKKEYTEEELEVMRERMSKARASKS